MKRLKWGVAVALCATLSVGGFGHVITGAEARTVKSQAEILKEVQEQKKKAATTEETTWSKTSAKSDDEDELTTKTQATDLNDLSQEERVERIGEMCRLNYKKTGLLASVSTAQCILESGYLSTDLAQSANNCFGMKAELSGNTWADSTWDGTSIYTKQTGEEYDGQNVTITADFRKYPCIEDSIADHSAYLLNAKNGDITRYAGLSTEKDYRQAITIIKTGGYATDSSYIDKICSIIERFDLTQYDDLSAVSASSTAKSSTADSKDSSDNSDSAATGMKYFVRKAFNDKDSQLGAFLYLDNAKRACKSGYTVYDASGKEIYAS